MLAMPKCEITPQKISKILILMLALTIFVVSPFWIDFFFFSGSEKNLLSFMVISFFTIFVYIVSCCALIIAIILAKK